jgi:hypothetical protein
MHQKPYLFDGPFKCLKSDHFKAWFEVDISTQIPGILSDL